MKIKEGISDPSYFLVSISDPSSVMGDANPVRSIASKLHLFVVSVLTGNIYTGVFAFVNALAE